MKELKEKFLKTYANIPLNLRDEIILVLEKEIKTTNTKMNDSITWRVAYLEVYQDTAMGEIILNELKGLDII